MFEKYLDKNGKLSGQKLRSFPPEERLHLLKKWRTDSLVEAIFCEKRGKQKPVCELCGKDAAFRGDHYSRWCGVSCSTKGTARRGSDSHLSKPEVRLQIKETLVSKYGVDNPQKIPEVRAQTEQTCLEKYGATSFLGSEIGKVKAVQGFFEKYGAVNISQVDDREAVVVKVRATMETIGRWVPLDELPDYVRYQRKILALTNKNVHLLANYDPAKRGPSNKNGDNWQVDHRLSVRQGWIDGVLPEHMAHPANLQFIPWRENRSKHTTSDLTKEELLALIEEAEETVK